MVSFWTLLGVLANIRRGHPEGVNALMLYRVKEFFATFSSTLPPCLLQIGGANIGTIVLLNFDFYLDFALSSLLRPNSVMFSYICYFIHPPIGFRGIDLLPLRDLGDLAFPLLSFSVQNPDTAVTIFFGYDLWIFAPVKIRGRPDYDLVWLVLIFNFLRRSALIYGSYYDRPIYDIF